VKKGDYGIFIYVFEREVLLTIEKIKNKIKNKISNKLGVKRGKRKFFF
jgi:hypothetical protein